MQEKNLVNRIRALRNMTIENGCSPAETTTAMRLANKLEARLSFKVNDMPTHQRPSKTIRMRVWRQDAQRYDAEDQRRKAEAMSHIIGLSR
jgi:hypothetical protein